jgi:hypothetical protein
LGLGEVNFKFILNVRNIVRNKILFIGGIALTCHMVSFH